MFGRPHKGHSTRKVIECAHFAAIPTDRRLSHSRFNAVLKYTVGLGGELRLLRRWAADPRSMAKRN
jgi:hypothetical protein